MLLLTLALRPIEMGVSEPAYPGTGNATGPYALPGAKDLVDLHRQDDVYRERLYRLASEGKIGVADAAATFAVHQGEALFGPYDVVHTNVAGACVVAQTVYKKLSSYAGSRLMMGVGSPGR